MDKATDENVCRKFCIEHDGFVPDINGETGERYLLPVCPKNFNQNIV